MQFELTDTGTKMVADFVTVLMTVPQAADACSAVLVREDYPFPNDITRAASPGMRCLRMVCKGFDDLPSRMARRFTMYLSSKVPANPHVMLLALMGHAQLTDVGVEMASAPREMPKEAKKYQTHLLMALGVIRPALSTVKRVFIHTPHKGYNDHQTPQIAAGLLAAACPKTQTLHLQGVITRATIASFGEACSDLTTLNVTHGSVCDDARQLHEIAPKLATFSVEKPPYNPYGQNPFPAIEHWDPAQLPPLSAAGHFCSTVMLTCSTLLTISFEGHLLDTPTWEAFPLLLRNLTCGLSGPITSSRSLPALQSLTGRCRSLRFPLSLRTLASILALTPSLAQLEMYTTGDAYRSDDLMYLEMRCNEAHLPDLLLINSRLSKGLVMSNAFRLLLVSRKGMPDAIAQDDDIAIFILTIPPDMRCTALMLEYSPMDQLEALPASLPSRFPALESLGILSTDCILNSELAHLAKCTALRHLSLASREGSYSSSQLIVLCYAIRPLCVLRIDCQGDTNDVLVAQQILSGWTPHTVLETYIDKRLDTV